MRLTTAATVAAVASALGPFLAPATASGWRWTPGYAGKRLVGASPRFFGDKGALDSAGCAGRGPAVAGRYGAFKCVGVFPAAAGVLSERVVIWVRVAPLGTGKICASVTSMAAIPASCLATRTLQTGPLP